MTKLTDITHLIIDMDGVLYRGDKPVPRLQEFFAFLRRRSIPFILATNNSTRTPEAYTGDLVSDLNGKRARVLGITPEDKVTVIDAQAPLAEMLHYATDLRSLTQGRATFEVKFDHYEEVPDHVAKKVIEAAAKEHA